MTPYPHPHGDETSIILLGDTDRVIVETTRILLPADKLAALVAIAGTLNTGCTPGWVEFRGNLDALDEDGLDHGSDTIRESTADWLADRGLLERDEMAWHKTYKLSSRGKRVVELAKEGA